MLNQKKNLNCKKENILSVDFNLIQANRFGMIYSNIGKVLVVGLLLPTFTTPAPLSSLSDLSKLVLGEMPWEVTRKPCEAIQCKHGHKLCKNGGVCEVTRDCSFKCKCQDGFTGWFCQVKVSPTTKDLTLSSSVTLSSTSPSSIASTTVTTIKFEETKLDTTTASSTSVQT